MVLISRLLIPTIPYSYEVQAGTTASTAEEEKYQELFNAFYKTIFDCGDISVGGFASDFL